MTKADEAERQPAAPLSVAQEAMWYASRLAPDQPTYNEAVSIRKEGPLDVPAMRITLDEIVRRHESLRTHFEVVDGRPAQVIDPPSKFELPVTDLGHLTADEAERQAVRLTAEVARVRYDLRRGPVLRPRLFRFPREQHRLYLAMHHVAFDGVSLTRVVLPEFVALYDAFAAGLPSPLPDPTITYADYARWEQQWIGEPRAERRLDYWVEHLAGAPNLSLPYDRERPDESRRGGGAVPLSLPRAQVERLRQVGQSTDATLFQVLMACWALLLGRYSGQQDVVFATAADLRQRPELSGLVGCCVTPLVVRVGVGEGLSFGELVKNARNELLDGLDKLVPFERVVRRLPPSGRRNGNPVYQTMIVLEPATKPVDPAWSVHQIDSALADACAAFKLDLELQLDERPDGELVGQLLYDRDLFEPSTARRIVDSFVMICSAVTDGPDTRLAAISVVGEAERRRQLVEWNATSVARPQGSVDELIEARAAAQPDSIAVTNGERTIDYAGLVHRAETVARSLAAAGVREGDVVALAARPSPDLVAGALGILKAGAAHLLLDPDTRDDQGQGIVQRAGAKFVLAEGLDDVRAIETGPGRSASRPPCHALSTDGPIETAGGGLVAHDAVTSLVAAVAAQLGIGGTDATLMLGSSILRAPAVALWLPLITGGKIVTLPGDASEPDGALVSNLARAEQVTFLAAPSNVWQGLIDSGLAPSRSLTALNLGGHLPRATGEAILARCRVLWNSYGPPPSTGCSTLGMVERATSVTIGRPIANSRAYVLGRKDTAAPVGVVGELVIGGDTLASGFLDPAGRLGDDPCGDGNAYRTGERASWLPDGRLRLRDDHPL